MPIFCKNNVHSQKDIPLSCTYFVQKTSILSKHGASCHFHQFFQENTPAVMPTFGQNYVNFVNTTLYYGLKKSAGHPFCRLFTKNRCSHARILEKNVHSLKKHTALMPKFSQKTLTFSKTLRSQGIFFKFTIKKPLLPCPYFVRKNVNSVKTMDYGPKKLIRCPFFRFVMK